MVVYRLCKVGEVNKLLDSEDLESVAIPGKVFIDKQQEKNVNSHNYNFKVSYLHFFKDLSSIFYFYTEDKYICTYDIPDDKLEKYQGEGFYWDYRNFSKMEAVKEYAIPSFELSFSYLKRIDKIKEFINYEDYLFDPSLSEELETIYIKGKERSRTKINS